MSPQVPQGMKMVSDPPYNHLVSNISSVSRRCILDASSRSQLGREKAHTYVLHGPSRNSLVLIAQKMFRRAQRIMESQKFFRVDLVRIPF
jgi:hypothetical protein